MPLEISGKKGETEALYSRMNIVAREPRFRISQSCRPCFTKTVRVTAGNSSGITDGAAAVMVLSEEGLNRFGITPQARIVDYEICGVAPEIMGIGPVPAVRASAYSDKA